MRNIVGWLLAAILAGAAGAAAPPAPSPATAPSGAAPAHHTYLAGDPAQLAAVLPPAPQQGDARYEEDRRVFQATRVLQGTPRWQMATDDADLGTAAMLRHFSCSLDLELTPRQAPRLVGLLQEATSEAARSMARAKDYYKRQRPFLIDAGPICVPKESVANSFDYPSGHTTAGWAWALVLAQVDPPHALPLLVRGRAIGDSRVVCGVHNASAVEGARLLTGAVIGVESASPDYQADLAAARAELAGLRAAAHAAPEPARCAAEAGLLGSYW